MKTYTFAMIKPDAVAKRTEGKILSRIIDAGFTVERVVLTTWSPHLAKQFYIDLADKPFYSDLVAFTSSGPSYGLILSLPNEVFIAEDPLESAVRHWRNIIGATDPKKAAPGSIRNLFGAQDEGSPMMHNAVHGSDSLASVVREIDLMSVFGPNFGLHHLDTEWYSAVHDRLYAESRDKLRS